MILMGNKYLAGIGVGQSQALAFTALSGIVVQGTAPDVLWVVGVALLIVGVGILKNKKPFTSKYRSAMTVLRNWISPILAIIAGLYWSIGWAIIPEVVMYINTMAVVLLAVSLIDSSGLLNKYVE